MSSWLFSQPMLRPFINMYLIHKALPVQRRTSKPSVVGLGPTISVRRSLRLKGRLSLLLVDECGQGLLRVLNKLHYSKL